MSTNNLENTGTVLGDMIGEQNTYIMQMICQNNYTKIPTLLTDLIKMLANVNEDELDEEFLDIIPYKIDEKIEYNNVKKYKYIIVEYSKFYNTCENILNTMDNYNVGSKRKILDSIKIQYNKILGDLLLSSNKSRIETIRDNADKIIEKVENILRNRIEQQVNENLTQEEIDIGLLIIICYAFSECKILDKPKRRERC